MTVGVTWNDASMVRLRHGHGSWRPAVSVGDAWAWVVRLTFLLLFQRIIISAFSDHSRLPGLVLAASPHPERRRCRLLALHRLSLPLLLFIGISGRSQSLKRSRPSLNSVGAFTTKGVIWLRHRKRLLVMVERMALQGCSFTGEMHGASASLMADLVGNSYNSHAVIPLVMSCLANIPWRLK